ncbi:MAG: TerC family protein [Chitinophagaceae bacterium]|nr:TerC family protein [Chitinophagaceae bacterium]
MGLNLEIFLNIESWIALIMLTFMEIVLGIDNILFISIVTNKIKNTHQREQVRIIGLGIALLVRMVLLTCATWITQQLEPILIIPHIGEVGFFEVTLRDLILLGGGLFLTYKSLHEIHKKLSYNHNQEESNILVEKSSKNSITNAIINIILLDIVFSFDSILTAVGLTKELILMVIAVTISMFLMVKFSKYVSNFIHKYPSLEALALNFLTIIGFLLVIEAFHVEVPKSYVYVVIAFGLFFEIINIRIDQVREKHKKI